MSDKEYHYWINAWRFDPVSSELKKGNKEIKLQNQVAKVLMVLIHANRQLISKKLLMQKAWEGTVVTENSLDKAISELRKVFGGSRTNPMFIETIPKKGYRIIVPIKKIELKNRDIPTVKRKKATKWSLLLLIPLLAIMIYLFKTNTSTKKVLSPDGQAIASIKEMGDYHKLFVEKITDGGNRVLDSFAKPESVVLNWSSDSRNIIYNTTLEKNNFYSINIYNIESNKLSYIKFPKTEGIAISDEFPINSDTEMLPHEKLSRNNNLVHYIQYDENDTIKVLFENKIIRDFKWH